MGRKYKVGVIEGDGVGPEISSVTLDLLRSLSLNIEFVELNAGYRYYRKSGKLIEEDFEDKVKKLDAIIKGPLLTPIGPGTYRSINVLIRKKLDLYANVRPFHSFEGISLKKFNIVLIRENTEGLYVGIEGRYSGFSFSLRVITEKGAERIAEFSFKYALNEGFNRVTVVHKANILKETDGLFRNKFFEVAKKYPLINSGELIVDAAAYNLVKNPERFQVIVTPNLYGDILADLIAGLVGSLGLCGSAQIGDNIAVFEPVHGVALDIAGKGIANPVGHITAAGLMLNYLSTKHNDSYLRKVSKAINEGIKIVITKKKVLTPDLGGNASTSTLGNEIKKEVLNILNFFS